MSCILSHSFWVIYTSIKRWIIILLIFFSVNVLFIIVIRYLHIHLEIIAGAENTRSDGRIKLRGNDGSRPEIRRLWIGGSGLFISNPENGFVFPRSSEVSLILSKEFVFALVQTPAPCSSFQVEWAGAAAVEGATAEQQRRQREEECAPARSPC